jgi:hypothetical protein
MVRLRALASLTLALAHLRAWTRLRLANSWQSTKACRTCKLTGSLGREKGVDTLRKCWFPPFGGAEVRQLGDIPVPGPCPIPYPMGLHPVACLILCSASRVSLGKLWLGSGYILDSP